MILLSHPTGNANVRHALNSMHQAGLLSQYYTTLAFTDQQLSRLPRVISKRFVRRQYDLPKELIRTRPLREAIRLAGGGRSVSIDSIYRDLDRCVAKEVRASKLRESLKAIYAYEDGAHLSFRAAKRLGLRCIYEQPIGYWRYAQELLSEEAERNPQWASTLAGLRDRPDKLERKDMELADADSIVAATSFTQKTLELFPGKLPKCHVIPYGCAQSVHPPILRDHKEPLKVIFVGGLSQRKGLSYLFEAISALGSRVELTIIGRHPGNCKILDRQLSQHIWHETLSHEEVIQCMRQQDVMVFPSLFEGFGLVITEALAQGVPVITTAHTAGPEFIENGQNGYIVPIRDAHSISEKLDILDRDRDHLNAMKQCAWERSGQYSWGDYESNLAKWIQGEIR